MEIRYTDSFEEATSLCEEGYEPIECAFGAYGSVLGPLAMDHHGTESHRPGVAIRAYHEHFGALKNEPRFVVTGTPDADAVLAMICLSGAVEPNQVPVGFPELVDLHDRDPIGLDLTQQDHGSLLLAFNQTSLPRKEPGFRAGVETMVRLFNEGISEERERKILGTERSRMRRASEAVRTVYHLGGGQDTGEDIHLWEPGSPMRVGLVLGTVWGFDIWYQYAPVVVSYSARLEKVTLGCPNMEVAESLFGPGGLLNVYPLFGEGWGGRETVGGSPRGVPLVFEDARKVAERLAQGV